MNPDVFSTLLSPSLRSDTALLVETHFRFALDCTKDPLFSLQDRFKVVMVGVNKAGTIASHESLSVWVYDNVDNKDHTFVIERNPSNRTHAAAFLCFSQCPESNVVLESIQRVLRNMKSLSAQATTETLESLSTMMLPTNSEDEDADADESIPLLPVINDTLSELPNATSQTEVPQRSLGDVISLTLVRAAAAACVASGSSIPRTLADDTIAGIDKLNPDNCIRLFKPQDLPFFNLILLADVIHHFAPIYSLFENQCFWFANLLFEYILRYHTLPASAYASVATSSSVTASSTGPVPAPTPAVGTPNNADKIILPMRSSSDEAGRWMGILISDPAIRLTVITLVKATFEQRLQYYMNLIPPPA
jgi:hypothetical protein